MADIKQIQFGNRLRRIDRVHRSLAAGYVTTVDESGLIVARPERKGSHQIARSLFFCLLILMAFKAVLYAKIGDESYRESILMLQNGTVVEQFGAYVMTADPVTVRASRIIGGALQ